MPVLALGTRPARPADLPARSHPVRRSERALVSVIQEAVVHGVSTRTNETVLEQSGMAGVRFGPDLSG
jgi:hypothetical protein